MNFSKTTRNKGESGNALFLILIAVALFAALSYAITQSGRGSGGIDRETATITAGQVTEQAASIRTVVTRMIITGTAANSVTFTGATTANDVFDSATGGGGATQLAPPSGACVAAADCNAADDWDYTQSVAAGSNGIFVFGVGTAAGEALAVLQGASGVTLAVCQQIQRGLGFSTVVPPTGVNGPVVWGTPGAYAAAGSATTVKSSGTELDGQEFGCFRNTTAGLYAYYHTLIAQ